MHYRSSKFIGKLYIYKWGGYPAFLFLSVHRKTTYLAYLKAKRAEKYSC
jgi:hypothetical protein